MTYCSQDTKCSICYENMDSVNISVLMCGHKFHTSCIFKWRNSCPMCKNNIIKNDETLPPGQYTIPQYIQALNDNNITNIPPDIQSMIDDYNQNQIVYNQTLSIYKDVFKKKKDDLKKHNPDKYNLFYSKK